MEKDRIAEFLELYSQLDPVQQLVYAGQIKIDANENRVKYAFCSVLHPIISPVLAPLVRNS